MSVKLPENIGSASTTPSRPRSESPYSPKHLENLPLLHAIGREYRQTGSSQGATRGYVQSLSAWKGPKGDIFLRVHGANGTREEAFDLNTHEGGWHLEKNDDIVISMRSGLVLRLSADPSN